MEKYETNTKIPSFEYDSGPRIGDNTKSTNEIPLTKNRNRTSTAKQGGSAANETEALCRVCSDISTGKHYGQISCEGCKSFFKRSIRRKIEYVCRNNGKCRIYKELRNQCQACRFVKCQQMGMKKDAVQNIRLSNSLSPVEKKFESCKSEPGVEILADKRTSDNWEDQILSYSNLSNKTVLNSILEAENAAPILCVDNMIDQSMGIICSIAAWAKKLLFTEQIEMADKLLLLQNSWCQLFILNYFLCGLSNKLLLNRNVCSNSFSFVQSQLLALNRLPMDAVECGCLKAIIFFNPDTQLLFNCSLVDKAQKTFQEALESHVSHSSTDKTRFGRLLLRLPYLKELKNFQILEVFFNNDSEEYVNFIKELFQRLLTTKRPTGNPNRSEDS